MQYKTIELVIASGRSKCRGSDKQCLAPDPRDHIPEGSRALRICIYGAGGVATAFYCEVCMRSLIKDMNKVLNELGYEEC